MPPYAANGEAYDIDCEQTQAENLSQEDDIIVAPDMVQNDFPR